MVYMSEQEAQQAVSDYLKPQEKKPAPVANMRSSLSVALDTQPDMAAELRKVSEATGVPYAVLTDDKARKTAEKNAALGAFDFDEYARMFPNSAKFFSDPDLAKLGHDDIELTGVFEHTLGLFGQKAQRKALNAGTAIGVGAGFSLPAGLWGVFEEGAALTSEYVTAPIDEGLYQLGGQRGGFDFFDDIARFAGERRKDSQQVGERLLQPALEDAGFVEKSIYSGMQSVGLNLPGVLMSVITRNPNLGLSIMGATSFGTSAGRGLDEGLDPLAAGIYGLTDAVIEVGTERIPLVKFVEDLTAGSGVLKTVMNQLATEIPGELLATTLQNFNEWATLNSDEPFQTYLEALPEDLAQTFIATITAVGVQQGSITLGTKALDRLRGREQAAQDAEQDAQILEKITELAGASKILQRAPETFEQLVEQMSDGAPVTDVFIDPQELAQSGIDIEALAELSPSIKKQRNTSAQGGGLIRIPVSEYASTLAASEFGQPLIDVLRTDPHGMSRMEAAEFMKNAATELEDEVEKQLTDTVKQTAKSASRQKVEQVVLDQLTSANRFTADVNRPYASLLGHFYETMGERTGRSAEEFFAAHPVRIQAESPAGGAVLDQNVFDFTPGGGSKVQVVGDTEITYGVSRDKTSAEIILVKTPEGKRGQGQARKAVERFLEETDAAGLRVFLTPDPVGKSIAKNKLKEFYSSLGFVENRGRTKDFSSQAAMYRDPPTLGQKPSRNSLGLYSKLEQEVLNMNLPQWKPDKKYELTSGEKARLDALENTVTSTRDPNYQERSALHDKARRAEGVAKGTAVWEKIRSLPIKEEEIKWTGLEDYLKAGADFTRTEVVTFIKENGVYVEEVVADEEGGGGSDILNFGQPEDTGEQDEQDDPVQIWRADTGARTLYIFGNDNIGYTVRENDWRFSSNVVRENIYSFSEAEIQATGYAQERGDLSLANPQQARWGDYVTPKGRNYREIKFTLPKIDGDFFNDTHFPDRNVVAFLRVVDKTLVDETTVDTALEQIPEALSDDERQFQYRTLTYGELKQKLEEDTAFVEANEEKAQNLLRQRRDELGWGKTEKFEIQVGDMSAWDNLVDYLWGKEKEESNAARTIMEIEAIWRETGKVRRAIEALEYKWPKLREQKARDTARANTGKTYFIDEFQSDWHQEGRQTGYQTGRNAEEVRALETKARDRQLSVLDKIRTELGDKGWSEANLTSEYTSLLEIIDGVLPDLQLPEKFAEGRRTAYLNAIEFFKNSPNQAFYQREHQEIKQLQAQVQTERYGVPDAPFKGDNWISLGLKRALVQAVNEGADHFAWADADVLAQRWSPKYYELYQNQYDKKMPSIVAKLTKQKPTHVLDADNYDGYGYWTVPLTPEIKEQIRRDSFPFFQGNRGSFNPQTSTITLLNAADLSTFLHEAGHFFLETLAEVAAQPNAPQGVREDMDRVLQFIEIPDLGMWQGMTLDEQRNAHEKFARAFEAYLFEGKAPSLELQSIFQRFRDWLVRIYREIRNLNVELNEDIRRVFDRMLATDEVIREAEAARGFTPLFKDAAEAGMTEDEWSAYQKLGEDATAQAQSTLDARSLRDMQWLRNARGKHLKTLQKDARAKRNAIRAEVEAEVLSKQVHQAHRFITRGEYVLPEDVNKKTRRLVIEIAEGSTTTKLSLPVIQEFYGEGDTFPSTLPKGRHGLVAKDGLDFNVVADMFGYTSGDQMLKDLIAREDPAAEIEALTDRRMLERYGDISDPASLERAADEAIHNDARTRFVATELAALQKATGGKKILTQAAKEFAAAMIARLKIRDLKPSRYTAAEGKAARRAEKARKAGDLQTAAAEKRNQLVQLYATKAATEALAENEQNLKYLRKFERTGTRDSIDADYLDQIDAILERFDLRKSVSLRALAKRKSLAEWLKAQEEIGIEPDIPDDILNHLYKKSYKDATVGEMRALVDTIKQIEHLGRLKNKLLTLKDQRQFNRVVEDISDSIYDNSRGKTVDNTIRATAANRAKTLFSGYLAQHRKLASIARQLDGVKDGGAVWEALIRTMNEAGDKEASMRAEVAGKLLDLSEGVRKLGRMGGMGEFYPTLNRSLNREERLAIVLNMGNEGNMQRLLDGKKWSRDDVQPVIDSLTAEEVKFVQDVWDLFESYRPQIAAKERRIYGKEPEWIEPVSLETPHGPLRGGYYPIKYDTRQSAIAAQHDAAEVAAQQLKGAYTSATTRRSFTKTRAAEVRDRPVLLTMDGLYGGMNEVIHDLAWHEWLIDANRLLRSKRVTQAVLDTQGADIFKQMKEAVKDIAAGDLPTGGAFEKLSSHARAGASVAGLGLNIVTSMINVTGITQSMVRVGPRWVAQGIAKWTTSPVQTVEEIYSKSEFMRLRGKTMMREINEIQSLLRDKSRAREFIDRLSFLPLTYTQVAIDTPTWWGAYQKALAEGNDDARAVALADQAVIDAQGSGMVKDLAAIQRGGPLLKLWTTFYSYFSTTYQLSVEQASKTNFKDPLDVVRLAGDYFLLYVVPAAMGALIRGAVMGDDEPEEYAERYANEQISYLLGGLVGLREATIAAQKAMGVNKFYGGYGGPAGLRLFQELDKLGAQVGQGEFDAALRRSLVNVTGVLLRLPSTQANKTIDGIVALMDGDTQNPAALVFGAPAD